MTITIRLPKYDWVRLTLIGLLIIGGFLRLYNLNWDEYQHAHPDERHITWVATSIAWPEDPGDLFDPLRTALNPFRWPVSSHPPVGEPRTFTYGHFPLYMLAATAHALSAVSTPAEGGAWADYDHIQLVGRALSGLWDTLTILLIYLLGRELFGKRIGLLAAAFQAFTVLHIQLSHFASFDAIMGTFVVMSVLFAVRGVQRGKALDFLLAGMAAGLAIGSLARALPILLPVCIAPIIRLLRDNGNLLRWGHWDSAQRRRAYALLALVLAAGLLAVVTFAVTNPFSLIDAGRFLKDVGEQGRMVRGDADFPFTRQYRGTLPFLYQIEQQVRWGMGWPLGLAGFAGLAWAVWRLIRGRASGGELIILAWVIPYFLINGAFMVKFMRYMVILTPFLCLYAGHLVGSLAVRLRSRDNHDPRPGDEPAGHVLDVTSMPGPAARHIHILQAWAARYTRHLPWRWMAVGLVVVALGWTIVYALGFWTIYTRPHTWITASRWMYQNIPEGATIAVEHWDDEMPKPLRDQGLNSQAHSYRHVTLPLYEEDNEAKYNVIRQSLQEADYIVLATNRLYRSIPRLPQRYPMTIRYYELLFSGELGFELLASFTSYPRLGPVVWVDDNADESFTVYDHPKPLVFQKVRSLSDQEFYVQLGGSWRGAISGWVGAEQEAKAPEPPAPTKSLMLDQAVDQLPVVDDFRWNRPASERAWLAALVWWLALMLVGLAAAPLAWTIFERLRDRGWALSKALGLLVVGYVNWLGASLHITQNRTIFIVAVWVALAGVSAALFWRRRAEMWDYVRRQWRLILTIEALFALAYAVFVVIRLHNPDLWQPWTGGEKSMEFAFLNAVLKSAHFVPYDPYFAGGTLNYYYYGQYLISLLIKLTGITPSVAFNLAIPSLFALTVSGAFGVAYTLAARLRRDPAGCATEERAGKVQWTQGIAGGLFAAAFVALMGNLDSLGQVVKRIGQVGGSQFQSNIPGLQPLVRLVPGVARIIAGQPLPSFDYWGPSRVIPATINEFPFWSFLFADLHPHMIAIPFTILALGMALNLCLRPAVPSQRGQRYAVGILGSYVPTLDEALAWLLLPLGVGALGAINTWDLPTYLGAMLLAYALRAGLDKDLPVAAAKSAVFAAYLGAGSLLLYGPFYRSYAALNVGIGVVRGVTDGWLWLTIWGAFGFMGLSYHLVELRRPGERLPLLRLVYLGLKRWERLPRLGYLHGLLVAHQSLKARAGRWGLLLALLGVFLFAAVGRWAIALALLPLIGAALLFMRRQTTPEGRFTNLLFFAGFLVLCGVEAFFMKDFLQGGDHYRMNTLFKFYIQVWVLLGIACGATLPAIWSGVSRAWSRPGRRAWQIGLAILLVASFLFVPLGVPARLADRFPEHTPPVGTLDGMAYMTVGSFTWPDPSYRIELKYDYEAIQWLLNHVKGTPVVAEAGLGYYREGGLRVASYTGLPTLAGMHQNEQRPGELVGQREDLIRRLFDTPDMVLAQSLIEELNISLIYIGQLERSPNLYSAAGIEKFERMATAGMLREVYRNPEVAIYAVAGKLPELS